MRDRLVILPKWRPPLALVIYSLLLTVLALPVLLLAWFRPAAITVKPLSSTELGALAVVLAFTVIIGFVLVRAIKAPLDALVARSREIAADGRDAIRPLESYGTREVATLAQGIFDLASDLVERTDYVRTFATHVSHELKSPLTAIAGAAELLREAESEGEAMTPAQRRRFLDNIVSDARRLDRLLIRLRELAQAEAPVAPGKSELSSAMTVIAARFPDLRVVREGDWSRSVPLPAEAATITLQNLAENALQHGATQLKITIEEGPDALRLRVEDDGSGISPDVADAVFRPFYTTRAAEGGTGMGLRIVEAVLAAHGASIRLDRGHRSGVAFDISMPREA
ncbi:HAMP domain-containing histidine kinase [Rhizobium sp. WL3]|uniref:sensor histidine kinase n=1 Tax=Rhizobium sp. WL3 TaxID=2603277 RepID=UPI0011C2087B|nr:HAMP domain-containing sensor histidine kinase [Rhizobium sp. WL3]QEE46539.1 HAMP domain-containing histidine kinase [Rhizobium sp. WL3]